MKTARPGEYQFARLYIEASSAFVGLPDGVWLISNPAGRSFMRLVRWDVERDVIVLRAMSRCETWRYRLARWGRR